MEPLIVKMASIYLRNIACFEENEFKLGSIVLIQSANAGGKSSLLNAITYTFSRGHDFDLLRAGTESGEVLVTFDDGTQVRAALTKDKTERMTKPPGGKRWNRGREFIESMTNALSYDPVAFLQKSDKEQVSDILRLMPIELDPAEIQTALHPIYEMPEIIESVDLAGRSPLDQINTIRAAVYEARTTTHVAADTHEKHAGELEVSLQAMAVDGTDWGKEVGKLREQIAGIDGAHKTLYDKLAGDLRTLIATEEGKSAKLMLLKENSINEQIAKLRQELSEYKNECGKSLASVIDNAKSTARQNMDDFAEQQADDRTKLATALAQAEQSYTISLKLDSTRGSIIEAKKQAGEARVKWKAMTACLENIDRLKSEVASRLPIPCTIADGRICREENGALVPLSKWNDASRWTLALKIATLCHGQAGFVCIDSAGFDAFDPGHKRAFLAACQKYVDAENMQFVLATVSDSDLKVFEVADV